MSRKRVTDSTGAMLYDRDANRELRKHRLAICRTVARFLGGDVTVKSELGVGSEFTLSIPYTVPEPGSFHRPTNKPHTYRLLNNRK